jgi:putative hydrolase of HD superfamily
MAPEQATFGSLFKKFRLRSEFTTLTQFGNALAQKGFIYEDSIYSHWQKNVRIPKDRKLLLTLITIFIEKGGITRIAEANMMLTAAGQGYLTEDERAILSQNTHLKNTALSPASALAFLRTTARSKRIVRTGWTMFPIHDPESVAEHSYQLCVMAMTFADHLGVDREKLIQMAIIHDLGEIATGDIVWSRGNLIDIEKRRKKEQIELEEIEKIFQTLGHAASYKTIFAEMVQRKTNEADVFWQMDKLEMAVQALTYEIADHVDLSEFFVTVDLHLTHPFLRAIFAEIVAKRPTLPARSKK